MQQDRLLGDGSRRGPHIGAEVFWCTVRREVNLTCKGVGSVLVVTGLHIPIGDTATGLPKDENYTLYQGFIQDLFLGGGR